MDRPKQTIIVLICIIMLGMLYGLSNNLLFNKSAIYVDCKTQNVFISVTIPPPMCIACFPLCIVELTAYNESEIICSGKGGDSMSESGRVECKDLWKYLGKNITVYYNITSEYGNYTDLKRVIYVEKKK